MGGGWHSLIELLVLLKHELLAFACFWFCVGLADEFALDIAWLWLRLTGRADTGRLPVGYSFALWERQRIPAFA